MILNSTDIIKEILHVPMSLDQALTRHQEVMGSNKPRTQILFDIEGKLRSFIIPSSISKTVESLSKSIIECIVYTEPTYLGLVLVSKRMKSQPWPYLLTQVEQRKAIKNYDYFLLSCIQYSLNNDPTLYDIKVLMEGYVDLILENLSEENPRPFSITIRGID
jgi:hypothetical protein